MSHREMPNEAPLSTAMRALAYTLTGAIAAVPLSTLEGIVAAALGAGLGALLGRWLASTPLRSAILGLGGIMLFVVARFGASLIVGSGALAGSLGPAAALRIGEAASFGSAALVLAGALRALSMRHRPVAIVETATTALAFGALVYAHRNGAIHRPYEIADPLLERGQSPELAILAVGALAAVVVGLLLLSERNWIRAAFHQVLILLLMLAVVAATSIAPPPPAANATDPLALRDDEANPSGSESESQSASGGGGNSPAAPDFRDEVESSGAQAPVAIALLHDDYSPPSGAYYFRQEAFSQFNGRRLVAATRDDADRDVATNFPTAAFDIVDPPPDVDLRTRVETTVGMLIEHSRPFGLESPVSIVPLENPDRARFSRTYRVSSLAMASDEWSLLGHAAGDATWSPELLAHFTRAPTDPRYRQLAEEMLSQVPDDLRQDPYARALAVTTWLGREGVYSLRSRHASADDPTADFLFGDKIGYCVHFAHASVYLMRSLGLPARVATGYLVDESSRRGGSAILITGSNGHAWPEIYLDGVGWVVVDVHYENALDPPPSAADPQLQQLLAEMLRGLQPVSSDGEAPPPRVEAVASWVWGWARAAIAALLASILVAGYAVKLVWYLRPALSGFAPSASYRAALLALVDAGIHRDLGESREAFARRLQREYPSFAVLTRAQQRAAWGTSGPSTSRDEEVRAEESRSIRSAYAELSRDLGHRVPWYRRLAGTLHPFAWWHAV